MYTGNNFCERGLFNHIKQNAKQQKGKKLHTEIFDNVIVLFRKIPRNSEYMIHILRVFNYVYPTVNTKARLRASGTQNHTFRTASLDVYCL